MSKTIKENVTAEIVEKKSKFIANIFYVQSIKQAEEKINEMRKKYYDARHNCFAFRIIDEGKIIERSSDDGEPSGTAGAPMRNILEKHELTNILVVVTRYFGGILLGTGGLVRAYSEVVQIALKKAEYVEEQLGYEMEIEISYSDIENWNYYCKQNSISIIKMEYKNSVISTVEITILQEEQLLQRSKMGELKFNISNYKIGNKKVIRTKM